MAEIEWFSGEVPLCHLVPYGLQLPCCLVRCALPDHSCDRAHLCTIVSAWLPPLVEQGDFGQQAEEPKLQPAGSTGGAAPIHLWKVLLPRCCYGPAIFPFAVAASLVFGFDIVNVQW